MYLKTWNSEAYLIVKRSGISRRADLRGAPRFKQMTNKIFFPFSAEGVTHLGKAGALQQPTQTRQNSSGNSNSLLPSSSVYHRSAYTDLFGFPVFSQQICQAIWCLPSCTQIAHYKYIQIAQKHCNFTKALVLYFPAQAENQAETSRSHTLQWNLRVLLNLGGEWEEKGAIIITTGAQVSYSQWPKCLQA